MNDLRIAESPVADLISAWRGRYGADEVDLGAVLCDGHAAESGALLLACPGGDERLTYGQLAEASRSLAGSLQEAGFGPGDRIAVMLPKSAELLIALLALWRIGAVHVPLFTAFGPDAAGYRLGHSGARLVIVDEPNRAKIGEPEGCRVMSVAVGGGQHRDDLNFRAAVDAGSACERVTRSGDDLLILLYTSGTTGNPKGVEVPVRALASFHAYMHFSLDLRPEDTFWNIADPGWGYGLWFAVLGPLLLGQRTLMRPGRFDPGATYAALIEHGVTNLTGAPTVYRSLRAAGVPTGFREACRLRVVSSAGEPLNPELLAWSQDAFGTAIHDHYGQSELGMPIGFGHHAARRRQPLAGSMGFAAPGFRPVVLDDSGAEVRGEDGAVAIDSEASPLYWFRGYYDDPERTGERFPHGARYYLSGDAARLDDEDLFHFASRADDVITSSGYRIGPFEVESALMAHPAVAEAAVAGVPDDLRGEAVAAFVVTTADAAAGEQLAEELQAFVKERLAKHLYPRHILFAEGLPRTPSGKIKRGVLRQQWRETHP